jgi:hypothetical protein
MSYIDGTNESDRGTDDGLDEAGESCACAHKEVVALPGRSTALTCLGVVAVCEWVDALADKHTTCYTTTTGGFEFSVTGALVKRKDFLDTDVEAKVRFCLECVRLRVCVRVCIMRARDVRAACLIYPP